MPKKMSFEATLQAGGEEGAWPIITIPFDVQEVFGSRARVSVKGTINGFPYRSSIFPEGNGTHTLTVNRSMRDGANVKVGDVLNVVMEVDSAPRSVDVPADFKDALSKNKKAREFFETLPPSHKRAYVEAIMEAKKSETRTKRIDHAIEMLAKGKK